MKAILAALTMVVATLATAAALACPGGYGHPPPPQGPDVFLRSIYDRYVAPATDTIDYSKDAVVRQYFTPELADIMMKDRAAADARGEVPNLNGDPFVGSQEWTIASFDIKVVAINATRAEATVKFTNYNRNESFKVSLWLVGGQWRINDIDYGGEAGTLRGVFKVPN
jgi:hypothetical protein